MVVYGGGLVYIVPQVIKWRSLGFGLFTTHEWYYCTTLLAKGDAIAVVRNGIQHTT